MPLSTVVVNSLHPNMSTNSSQEQNYYVINGSRPFKQYFECSYLNTIMFQNGSISFLESEDEQDSIRSLCYSKNVLSKVFFWLAVALGIPGNLSAFITLVTMPKSTCTFYIALLSVLDLFAILLKMTMGLLNKHGIPLGDAGCKILMMVTNFVVTYANWVLVLICIERFVTIRFPLKKPIYFTNKRAWYSAAALGCCLLPFFSVVLVTYEASPPSLPRSCQTRRDLQKLSKIWSDVITAFYSFIPAVLLFLLAGLITLALRQHKKRRESMWENCQEQRALSGTNGRNVVCSHSINQRHQLNKMERSVTGMLLVAAIVFVILTLPICVLMVVKYDVTSGTPQSYARWQLNSTIARAMTLLSHALNCYIYFLTCKKFRQRLFGGFAKMCVRFRKTNKSPIATTRFQITDSVPSNHH